MNRYFLYSYTYFLHTNSCQYDAFSYSYFIQNLDNQEQTLYNTYQKADSRYCYLSVSKCYKGKADAMLARPPIRSLS